MKIEIDGAYEHADISAEEKIALKSSIFPQIKSILDQLGIPRNSYVIDGEGSYGELCLVADRSLWVVFGSERGERYNCAFFTSLRHAANYFIWELMRSHKNLFPDHPSIPFKF